MLPNNLCASEETTSPHYAQVLLLQAIGTQSFELPKMQMCYGDGPYKCLFIASLESHLISKTISTQHAEQPSQLALLSNSKHISNVSQLPVPISSVYLTTCSTQSIRSYCFHSNSENRYCFVSPISSIFCCLFNYCNPILPSFSK